MWKTNFDKVDYDEGNLFQFIIMKDVFIGAMCMRWLL